LRRRDPHPFRYADLPDPQSAKIVVEQGTGRVIGYERGDGTFVAAGSPCCSDPTLCQRGGMLEAVAGPHRRSADLRPLCRDCHHKARFPGI
jgi:hypothetical protein